MNQKSNNKKPYYTGEQSLSPIPLHVGSPVIRKEDSGKIKATALQTMEKQAQQQIDMLRKQADLIMEQVDQIRERVTISREIYEAKLRFTPQIGETYHLYITSTEEKVLSMISPSEWGDKMPYKEHKVSVTLLADKTWEVI